MAKSIQIAPNMEQIRIDYANNLIIAEYCGQRVEYRTVNPMYDEWEDDYKKCLRMAIGFASKPWHVERAMGDANIPGHVYISTIKNK